MEPSDDRQKGKAVVAATAQGNEHRACPVCEDRKKRCGPDCIFNAYPTDLLRHLAVLKKVYGFKKVGHLLQQVPEAERPSFMRNLVIDAVARDTFPAVGFVDIIDKLSRHIAFLRVRLAVWDSPQEAGQPQPQETNNVLCNRDGNLGFVSFNDMVDSLGRIQQDNSQGKRQAN